MWATKNDSGKFPEHLRVFLGRHSYREKSEDGGGFTSGIASVNTKYGSIEAALIEHRFPNWRKVVREAIEVLEAADGENGANIWQGISPDLYRLTFHAIGVKLAGGSKFYPTISDQKYYAVRVGPRGRDENGCEIGASYMTVLCPDGALGIIAGRRLPTESEEATFSELLGKFKLAAAEPKPKKSEPAGGKREKKPAAKPKQRTARERSKSKGKGVGDGTDAGA
jgi:hypothetical protein